MRVAKWKDYELLDASSGERLERWGNIVLIRPDPQIIWNTGRSAIWNRADAVYHRSKSGGGYWEEKTKLPSVWKIQYNNLTFGLKPMGFKHTGVFPEQAVNWDFTINKIKNCGRKVKILNLFAYTGAATLAAASAGAEVCHVDASKGMVTWARENAKYSNMSSKPIRWLVDGCIKFVKREQRRGNKYDGIIMDPPSYGRGPGGEVWKLEDELYNFVNECSKILSDNALFFMLNSYTSGLSSSVMEYIVNLCIQKKMGGTVTSDEIGLNVTSSSLILPCGSTVIWESNS